MLFTAVLGSACYALPAKRLDEANSVLVAGVVASFVALLAVVLSSSSGSPAGASSLPLDLEALSRADWGQLLPALPVLALAFVFQNTVSVVVSSLVRIFSSSVPKFSRERREREREKKKLTFLLSLQKNTKKNQQEGDAKKIRTAIVAGTILPLFMFLAWDAVSLGGSGSGGASSSSIVDPVAALSASSPLAAPLVATFSMLALITSFVGFVLGLTDFLADALPVERRAKRGEGGGGGEAGEAGQASSSSSSSLRLLLPLNPSGRARAPVPYALTLLPPLLGAVAVPGAFLSALSAAGTYGVMALFGVLPAALAAVSRERRREAGAAQGEKNEEDTTSSSSSPTLVPGGALVLYAVGGIAAAVIANETVSRVMMGR